MEIHALETNKKDGKCIFILKQSSPAFANTLRKYVLEKVPTLAIEDVEFRKNGSALYDELLAHRIGLIPLTTDLKSYNLPKACKCNGEGCARCSVKLTLTAKGPCTVYSSELKSKDSKVKPAYPNIPIVKLLKGQELEFEATAMLGQGKDHVKWSPGHIYYKYYPTLEIKGDVKDPEKIVEASPINIFSVKNGKLTVDKEKVIHADLSEELMALSPKIQFSEDKTQLLFYVESYGQLSCREMVSEAMELFEQDLNTFTTEFKKVAQ